MGWLHGVQAAKDAETVVMFLSFGSISYNLQIVPSE